MHKSNWVPFHFESNQVYGLVACADDWLEIKTWYHKAYGAKDIYSLKENINKYQPPEFGQQLDHKGDQSLKDFFIENGMELI